MEVRKQRIIELSKYGKTGEITLEPLNFRRRKQLENNIGKASVMENGTLVARDLGDIAVYNVMAHIITAPFKFDSLQGFYAYMDRVDIESGRADELFAELQEAVRDIERREDSPLGQSTDSVPQSTEPTD